MFIKIKLEPNNEKEGGESVLKTPLYFEVDDEATICEVKLEIEKHIDVPAERQEIRTITQTLQDTEKLTDINELIRNIGSTIMLYIYGAGAYGQLDEEPMFHCFLQLYNRNEAEIQQDYEKRSRNQNLFANSEPPSITSTTTLLSDCDSEDEDSTDTSGSNKSSETSTESDTQSCGSVSESAKPKVGRKRSMNSNQKEIKEKRAKRYTVIAKIPSDLTTYLEEFPKYSEKYANPNMAAKSPEKGLTTSTTEVNVRHSQTPIASKSPFKSVETKQKKATGSPSTTTKNENPCTFIQPEKRSFIVILRNIDESKDLEIQDCTELLELFYNIFKASEETAELKFNGNPGPILYEGSIWLACEDERTLAWTLAKSNNLSSLHKAQSFDEFFKLKQCVVVLPCMANTNLLDIFDLIEQQNAGIKTGAWSVLKRRNILNNDDDEFYKKSVSRICQNEVLYLAIDSESLNSLQASGYKLSYCFWKITFEVNIH